MSSDLIGNVVVNDVRKSITNETLGKFTKDEGDGIDWHVDGSIYLGQRWAGILVLIEDTGEDSAKLELQPNLVTTTLPKSTIVNSCLLYTSPSPRDS